MSDAKPCKWADVGHFPLGRHGNIIISADCKHPLLVHMAAEDPAMGRILAQCHGCPCHEPEPEPDHSGDTNKMVCWWKQDEHGNWCCSCRATMPQFTPWRGTSPTGHNCPYCRRIIWMEPRYDESIHTCGPHCERPACVQRRTDSGEFRQIHDKP